jgi:hypothetical protein
LHDDLHDDNPGHSQWALVFELCSRLQDLQSAYLSLVAERVAVAAVVVVEALVVAVAQSVHCELL